MYGHVITKFSRMGRFTCALDYRFTFALGALLKSYFDKYLDGIIQKMSSYSEQNLFSLLVLVTGNGAQSSGIPAGIS